VKEKQQEKKDGNL